MADSIILRESTPEHVTYDTVCLAKSEQFNTMQLTKDALGAKETIKLKVRMEKAVFFLNQKIYEEVLYEVTKYHI